MFNLHEYDEPRAGVVVLTVRVEETNAVHQRGNERSHVNKVCALNYLDN